MFLYFQNLEYIVQQHVNMTQALISRCMKSCGYRRCCSTFELLLNHKNEAFGVDVLFSSVIPKGIFGDMVELFQKTLGVGIQSEISMDTIQFPIVFPSSCPKQVSLYSRLLTWELHCSNLFVQIFSRTRQKVLRRLVFFRKWRVRIVSAPMFLDGFLCFHSDPTRFSLSEHDFYGEWWHNLSTWFGFWPTLSPWQRGIPMAMLLQRIPWQPAPKNHTVEMHSSSRGVEKRSARIYLEETQGTY